MIDATRQVSRVTPRASVEPSTSPRDPREFYKCGSLLRRAGNV